jgi:hypothetical protein
VQAGLLLLARTQLDRLGLPGPGVEPILEATGAGRSRAYELRDRILGLLPGLVRPPGRPRLSPPAPPPGDFTATLTREILRFVMDHPGCVHGGPERRCYADTFRHRVLELGRKNPDLDLPAFAEAVGVPAGTIEDWLRPGRTDADESDDESDPTSSPDDESDAKTAMIETVLHAWRGWRGNFSSFYAHVRLHLRLGLSRTLISQILFERGERTPKRRGRRHSDEEALRDAFETFFPGAQWIGDGKKVVITLDGESFAYNFELMVDAFSDAFVGISIRDEEDQEAVVEAFEGGIETTGAAPLAVTLDNRPSNHTESVDVALADTLRIRATQGRGQNKAHVEGGFGLFAQRSPPLSLRTDDRRELGRQVVALVAELFARLMNHRPRTDRGCKTRAELYAEQTVTDEEKDEARRALQERLRKQERARQTREARLDPEVRRILDLAFERLDLLDPERHVRNAIAGYPLNDIVDAIAIFEGKSRRGTLPDGVDARYLLGIVKNLHHVHDADAITDALLRRRLEARDVLLDPLVTTRDVVLKSDHDAALRFFVDHALAAERTLDRQFWIQAAADLIATKSDIDQRQLFRDAARRIHATFAVPTRDRFTTERRLARMIWPLS